MIDIFRSGLKINQLQKMDLQIVTPLCSGLPSISLNAKSTSGLIPIAMIFSPLILRTHCCRREQFFNYCQRCRSVAATHRVPNAALEAHAFSSRRRDPSTRRLSIAVRLHPEIARAFKRDNSPSS